MLTWIRKYDLNKAGYVSCSIGIITIIVHILVIIGVLPYLWVNGGRSESFSAAQSTSFSSIVITVISILITLIASQIIPVRLNRFWGIAISAFLIVTLPLSFIGIVSQFLGTLF